MDLNPQERMQSGRQWAGGRSCTAEGRREGRNQSGPQGPAWVCRDHPPSGQCPARGRLGPKAALADRGPHLGHVAPTGPVPPEAWARDPSEGLGEQEAEGGPVGCRFTRSIEAGMTKDASSPGPRRWVDRAAQALWAPLPGVDMALTTTDFSPCSGVSPEPPAVGLTSAVSSTAVTDTV